MKKQNEDITVKELFGIFLPKLWIILIVSVVAALLVGGYSRFIKKDTYTSYVSFIVRADTTSIPTSGGYDGIASLVSDYMHLLSSRTFCELVADNMNDTYGYATAEQVKSALSVTQKSDTNFIYAYVTSESPQFSKSAADAISLLADDFISSHCDYKVSIRSVDVPVLAKTADSKDVVKNAIIGFAIGFIGSAVVVFIASRFDVVIRSKEMLEKSFDIPILGVIPRLEQEAGADSTDEKRKHGKHASNTADAAQQPNVVDGRVVFGQKQGKRGED